MKSIKNLPQRSFIATPTLDIFLKVQEVRGDISLSKSQWLVHKENTGITPGRWWSYGNLNWYRTHNYEEIKLEDIIEYQLNINYEIY